jgi:peptidylprolyl isomerase
MLHHLSPRRTGGGTTAGEVAGAQSAAGEQARARGRVVLTAALAAAVSCGGTLVGVELAGGSLGGTKTQVATGAHRASTSNPALPVRVKGIPGVKVTGTFGSAPTVTISNGSSPPPEPDVDVLVKGPGVPLKKGELAVADDLGRTWRSSKPFESTYVLGEPPDAFPVGTNAMGVALEGIPVGSRVLVTIPPAEGFGISTNLPPGVKHTDTAVMVVDLIGSYAANQGPTGKVVSSGGGGLPTVSGKLDAEPVITVPHGVAPPKKLVVKTLVKGNGPAAQSEQLVVTQYVGVNWRTGKVFDSSWRRGIPSAYLLGSGEAIPAWETGLPGVTIGSRILMVVPPADGYGSQGQAQAGIKATDTLVFVVDVLGSYPT